MLLAVIAAFVLAPQAPTQSVDEKITFSSVARRAKPMLELLSKESGVSLKVAQSIENEVLIIHVSGVRLKDLMSRIEQAMDAEWQPEKDGFRLVRTDAKGREIAKRERVQRLKELTQAHANAMKLAKLEPFDAALASATAEQMRLLIRDSGLPQAESRDPEARRKLRRLESRCPGERLINRLLPMIDPAELASLSVFSRIVFSTAPTRMQRPFRAEAKAPLAAFVREQILWAQAVDRSKAGGEPESRSSWEGAYTWAKPIESGGVRALVIARRLLHQVELTLKVLDAKGDLVVRGSGLMTWEPPRPENVALDPSEPDIELTQVSRAIADAYRTMFGRGTEAQPMKPNVAKVIASPEEFDPLSHVVSDILIGFAKHRKQNLVANPTDTLLFRFSGPAMVAKASQALPVLNEWIVPDDPKWMVLRPPVRNGPNNMDRPTLGRVARSALAGRVTLEDMVAYAAANSLEGMMNYHSLYIGLINPEEGMRLSMLGDYLLLRLYALSPPNRRASMLKGEPFPVRAMSFVQQEIVRRYVFDFDHLDVDTDGADGAVPEALREPTESLPNGLPPDAYVKVDVWNEDKAFVIYDFPGFRSVQGLGAEGFATDLLMRERRPDAGTQSPLKMWSGRQTDLKFTLQLTPILSRVGRIEDGSYDRRSKPVLYDQMPQSFRDRVQAHLKWLKDQPAQQGPPPPEG